MPQQNADQTSDEGSSFDAGGDQPETGDDASDDVGALPEVETGEVTSTSDTSAAKPAADSDQERPPTSSSPDDDHQQ